MVELLRELATLENGLVLGLVAVVGYFLKRWAAHVDSQLESHASAKDVKELEERLGRVEKSVDTAGLRAASAFRNVVHMSKDVGEKLKHLEAEVERLRAELVTVTALDERAARVEVDLRRIQDAMDSLQRDVWAGGASGAGRAKA